jgi:nitrogen-specific signal transduction histidine kinase
MGDIKEKSGKIKTKTTATVKNGLEDTSPLLQSALDMTLPGATPKPAVTGEVDVSGMRARNLEALLDVSKAINSTLDLDEILKRVMRHAIELLNAERGFLMLLDEEGQLKIRTAYNINKEQLDSADDLAISRSVADRVATKGQSEYTSNAQEDPRYAHQKSVVALNLRFIICVPLKIKEKVIGVCYLDNQSRAGLFGKSDLRLFELFAEQAAIAIENAKLYGRLLSLTRYNENVVNKTPVGICVVDDQFRVITFNLAAESIFHSPDAPWTGADLVATHTRFTDILPSEEVSVWKDMLNEVLVSHKPLSKDKYFLSIGGRKTVLSIKISPLNGIVGEAPKIIIVVEDRTERTTIEEYLIRSEQMVEKAQAVRNIAHEMNNHLQTMSVSAELMPIHLNNNRVADVANACERILRGIDDMRRYTESLMEDAKFETKLVECHLKDVIEEHLFTIRPHKMFKPVQFTVDCETGLPPVRIDAGHIKSVLYNLYKNAVEACGERACEIRIVARHNTQDQMLEVRVSDNGPGLPPEIRPGVFSVAKTTKADGHGLGLLNCKTIIENHSGTIGIERSDSGGTTFAIRLPVHRTYASFES